jgi:hypothetical protein
MVYPNQTLIRIGREVLKKHPEIATSIIDEIPKPKCKDLDKINNYFKLFCFEIGVKPGDIKGPVFKSCLTEKKKIFIGAMYSLFTNQYRFSKTISGVLMQKHSLTSRMIDEVKFRYQKDADFKKNVDNILNKLQNDN